MKKLTAIAITLLALFSVVLTTGCATSNKGLTEAMNRQAAAFENLAAKINAKYAAPDSPAPTNASATNAVDLNGNDYAKAKAAVVAKGNGKVAPKKAAKPVTLENLAAQVARNTGRLNRHERMLTIIDRELNRLGAGNTAQLDGWEFGNYRSGSAVVTPSMRKAMAQVAVDLKKAVDTATKNGKNLTFLFKVKSFTDRDGNADQNAVIQLRRSQSAKKAFLAALKKVGITGMDAEIVPGETSERSKLGTGIDRYTTIEKEEFKTPLATNPAITTPPPATSAPATQPATAPPAAPAAQNQTSNP